MGRAARGWWRLRYDGEVLLRERLTCLVSLSLALWSGGCAAPPGGLDSPVPSERLRAVGRAVKEQDRSAVPKLITMLGSDDPVVRLVAIRALESLTGETHGYEHAAPEPLRQATVALWVAWYNRGGLGGNTVETGGGDASGGGEAGVGPAQGNADTVR